MSVLIVDDHQAGIDLLKKVLIGDGLQRVTAETDSSRVADLLPSINPDLVLLDLHMPDVDGFAVLESIKIFAAGTYLPVLVLTGDGSTDVRDRALAHGARDFLTKPLDLTEVVLRVANLLETRQLHAALRDVPGGTSAAEVVDAVTRRRIEAVLNENGVTPVFQPVVDLNLGTVIGYEALARFNQPEARGVARWFTDAFSVGLGVELERLAATAALPFLNVAAPGVFLAVNLSPASVLHLREEELCPTALCPRIVIELTEHTIVEDYSAIQESLAQMRESGARLAADDLGAGYAGLQHLLALEPDIIKLDISLVSGIHRRRGARALAKALVAFAADIGAEVIAEGVEQVEEAEELRALGVQWAQGFYLGRPEPSPFVGQPR